jgi:hypothetical protein
VSTRETFREAGFTEISRMDVFRDEQTEWEWRREKKRKRKAKEPATTTESPTAIGPPTTMDPPTARKRKRDSELEEPKGVGWVDGKRVCRTKDVDVKYELESELWTCIYSSLG